MSSTATTEFTKPLDLSIRYQAAWGEHAQRVAQRLQIVQMYLATAGVIFGFFYANDKRFGDIRLLTIITFLTLAVSMLVALENRAIARLCRFLRDCEKLCKPELDALEVNLFYFLDKDLYRNADAKHHQVDKSHYQHRLFHRSICFFILLGTNILPIYEARQSYPARSLLCLFIAFFSGWLQFHRALDGIPMRKFFYPQSDEDSE